MTEKENSIIEILEWFSDHWLEIIIFIGVLIMVVKCAITD